MKALVGRILRRFGYRRVLSAVSLIGGGMVAACGAFTSTTPWMVIFAVLATGGFFRSLQFSSLNTLAFADVPPARMSKATSLASTFQNVSQAFGIAFAAGVLEFAAMRHGGALTEGDFAIAFLCSGALAAASAWFAWRLPADAGHSLTRQPARSAEPAGDA
jgi:MFS family permease